MTITLSEIGSTIERGNQWTLYRSVTQIMAIALNRYDDGRKASGVLFLVVHGERNFEPQFPTIQTGVLYLPPLGRLQGEIVGCCPEKALCGCSIIPQTSVLVALPARGWIRMFLRTDDLGCG